MTYRHPGLLAKIVTTLDVLSGGRAFLGLGTAWYQREHTGLGVPFPPAGERFERLEETLRLCKQMWDPQANGPFEGRHYRLAETLCVPAPVSAPHPEINMDPGGTLDGFAEAMAEYAALGIDEAIVAPPDGAPARGIEHRAAPAAKVLAGLG